MVQDKQIDCPTGASGKSKSEPFPQFEDVSTRAVESWNTIMGLPPTRKQSSKDPKIALEVSPPPLFVPGILKNCQAVWDAVELVPRSSLKSHVTIPVHVLTMWDVLLPAAQLVITNRQLNCVQMADGSIQILHSSFTNSKDQPSPLVSELQGYISKAYSRSLLRDISPWHLYHELELHLKLALMEYIAADQDLQSSIRSDSSLHHFYKDILDGPQRAWTHRKRSGPPKVVEAWPRRTFQKICQLIEDMRSEDKLKRIQDVWNVWMEVIETLVRLCIWVNEQSIAKEALGELKGTTKSAVPNLAPKTKSRSLVAH